jgi:hypothetical protein
MVILDFSNCSNAPLERVKYRWFQSIIYDSLRTVKMTNEHPLKQTSHETNEPQGKPGAPTGNRNRQRHGLFGSQLPKGCGYINNAFRKLRRQLESAVAESHGDITVQDAALVNSAMRHERRVKLCERWLREDYSDLDIDKRMKIQKEISNATDSRDRCIEKLKLNRSGGPSTFYGEMSNEELLKRVESQ